jgi:DNA-binding transcriptional LysR family regulator
MMSGRCPAMVASGKGGHGGMKNLNDLVIFTKVVEKGGISAAAATLSISPSLASRRLSQLEADMGVQLVNRSTRHISLTEAGKEFYESCTSALTMIESARLSALSLSNIPRGTLRIHSAYGVGQSWVSQATAIFKQKFPDVRIDLAIGSDHENLLRDGYDLIIKTSDLQDSSLDSRDFGSVRHLIVAAPSYLDRAGTPQQPAELASHECLIQYGWRPANEWYFIGPAGLYEVKVDGSFKSTSAMAIRHAALSGLGIARLPEYALDREARRDLKVIFEDCVAPMRMLKAFFPRAKNIPAKVSAFLECLGSIGPLERDQRN